MPQIHRVQKQITSCRFTKLQCPLTFLVKILLPAMTPVFSSTSLYSPFQSLYIITQIGTRDREFSRQSTHITNFYMNYSRIPHYRLRQTKSDPILRTIVSRSTLSLLSIAIPSVLHKRGVYGIATISLCIIMLPFMAIYEWTFFRRQYLTFFLFIAQVQIWVLVRTVSRGRF